MKKGNSMEKYIPLIKNLNLFKDMKLRKWDSFSHLIEIARYQKGKTIIKQGYANDKSVYFILQGSVDIVINGKKTATRGTGEHVGEIVALFPQMPRTATVVIKEQSIIGKMDGDKFRRFISSHPKLYKIICETLSSRLAQRNNLIAPTNQIPKVFIGSSTEGKNKMNPIVELLQKECDVQKWAEDVFVPSSTTIESLENTLQQCDFAVLIISPDDVVTIRRQKKNLPRANIIFEAGLAMGYLGRNRTILVRCPKKGRKINFPTDIEGVTYVELAKKENILKHINKLGCR